MLRTANATIVGRRIECRAKRPPCSSIGVVERRIKYCRRAAVQDTREDLDDRSNRRELSARLKANQVTPVVLGNAPFKSRGKFFECSRLRPSILGLPIVAVLGASTAGLLMAGTNCRPQKSYKVAASKHVRA